MADVSRFVSKPSDVCLLSYVLGRDEWWPLGREMEVNQAFDCANETEGGEQFMAHLTYRDARYVVAPHYNARLVLPPELEALKNGEGQIISPTTLPDGYWLGLYPRRPGEDAEEHAQRLRDEFMNSRIWASYHDALSWKKVDKLPNLDRFPLGFGKSWIGVPVSKGRANLMGWWTGKNWIQRPNSYGDEFHDDMHSDYATSTILVRYRDGRPIDDVAAAPGDATTSASGGSVGAIVAAGLLFVTSLVGGGWYMYKHRRRSRKNV